MNQLIINGYVIDSYINAIIDFGSDPFIVINPYNTNRDVDVPMDYVVDGFLVLNISSTATGYVTLDKKEGYMYVASRFNKIPYELKIPLECIVMIRSRCSVVQLQCPTELISIGGAKAQTSSSQPQPVKQKPRPKLQLASYNGDIEVSSPAGNLKTVH